MEYVDKPKPSLNCVALPVSLIVIVVFLSPRAILLSGGGAHIVPYVRRGGTAVPAMAPPKENLVLTM